jgi:glutaredoxin
MEIKVHIYNEYDEYALKILKLLTDNKLEFTCQTYSIDEVEKFKKLPQVVIDDDRVGGYYDVIEYLINKKIINYEGTSCPIPNK